MILLYGLAFTAGALPITALPVLPGQVVAVLTVLLAVALLVKRPTRWVGFFALGLGHALMVSESRLADQLDPALAGHDLQVVGTIRGLPEREGRRTRFLLEITEGALEGRPANLPATVRISAFNPALADVRPGEVWRMTVRLQFPTGLHNPGGFDYPRWLLQEGIGATGYVRADPQPVRLRSAGITLDGVRDQLRTGIAQRSAGPGFTGLLSALAVGDRSLITAQEWDVLLITGTNHLIAISGLHVGLASLCGFALGRLLWLLPAVRVRTARPVFSAVIALILAAAYAALAGFAIPTQRALAMLAAGLGMVILRRRARPGTVIGLALLAVVAMDPLSTLSPGFWLSFAAVGSILAMLAARMGPVGRVEGWLRLQFGIALALLPILILLFSRTSVIGPLANLIAVPWVSLLVVPPTLAGTMLLAVWPSLAHLLLASADWLLLPLWYVLNGFAAPAWAELHLPGPSIPVLLLATAGVVLLLLPRSIPGRCAGVVCLLPLVLGSNSAPEPGQAVISILDVGEGSAAVVRTHNHVLVYGAGPASRGGFDTGSAVVVPYLRHSGIRALDMVVQPADATPATGGIDSVVAAFPPQQLLTPQGGAGASACRAGMAWEWDEVRFRVLHPAANSAHLVGDDRSCVLLVETGTERLLLAGELGPRGAWTLLGAGEVPAVDVLLLPRQGRETSGVVELVEQAQPSWLVLSADDDAEARHRTWGSAATQAGGRLLHTGCMGTIRFELGAGAHSSRPPWAWREQQQRFWQRGCAYTRKSVTMRPFHPASLPVPVTSIAMR